MAKEIFISGQREIENKLMMAKNQTLNRTGIAVEKSCIDVANHAKAGHESEHAHADERYRNQTGTLTRSIKPALEKVNFFEVTGVVFSNIEYASTVEIGGDGRKPYPFLFPALVANKDKFEQRMKGII